MNHLNKLPLFEYCMNTSSTSVTGFDVIVMCCVKSDSEEQQSIQTDLSKYD